MAAGLTVDIDDADDPVEVGKPTRYTITVVNQGQAAASNVRIVANVPDQMEPTGAKGPTTFKIEGQRVVFEPLMNLAGASEAAFQVDVRAQESRRRPFPDRTERRPAPRRPRPPSRKHDHLRRQVVTSFCPNILTKGQRCSRTRESSGSHGIPDGP